MIGILIITVLAFVIGILLVTLDKKEISKKEEYLKRLPEFNCGGCGFGSCEGMAEAMCEAVENYKKCKPLRGEKLEEMEAYVNSNE